MPRFTEEFRKSMEVFTDAPASFVDAGGLFLLSTVIGRDVKILGPRERYLNLWFLLEGVSRISRKTTILYWCKRILKQFAPPIIPLKAPKGTRPRSPLLMPSSFSPEAFFTVLSEDPQRAYIKDELSGFIKSFKKGYMADMPELLSRVYDCGTEERFTKTHGREIVDNPYLTILSASTPIIGKYFTEDLFEQGFGNRFIYVVDLDKDRELKPFKFFEMPKIYRDHIDRIVKHLNKVRKLATKNAPTDGKLIAPFQLGSEEKLNRFESAINQQIKKLQVEDPTNLDIGYLGQLPEFVKQIAGLFSIDQIYDDPTWQKSQDIPISPESVDEAISYARMIIIPGYEAFQDIIRSIRPEKKASSRKGDLDLVRNVIKRHGKIKKGDIYKKTGIGEARELDDLLAILMSQNLIIFKLERTGGRPAEVYEWCGN